MRSTMQDAPLTVGALVTHAAEVHGRLPVSATRAAAGGVGAPEVVTRPLRGVLDTADRLADVLHTLGVRGDAVVATLSRNTVGHLAAYAAVPSMGAVLHPVNIRLPTGDIAGILDAAGDEVVLVDADVLADLAPVLAGRPALRHVVVLDPDRDPGDPDLGGLAPDAAGIAGIAGVAVHDGTALLAAASAAAGRDLVAAAAPDERDAAALCFTSGSTGRPRGVAYSHRSIHLHSWGIAAGDAFAFGPEHTVLPVVPMFHVLAWGLPYAALLVGAGLALPGRFTDPAGLLALAAAAGATHAAGVPTVFARVLDHLRDDPAAALPGELRELMVGGAPCPPALLDGFAARGVAVRHAWGMTETSPLGSLARADPRADDGTRRRQQLSQGRLASGVRGRVTGPDGVPLPADGGSVGELQVRGPWVTARYLDEPAAAAREWLPTGDLATLHPDGFLVVVDRVADLVKSGGEWISPRRVETLLAAVDGVADVAVVAVPDDVWGQRPAAVLVLTGTAGTAGEAGAPGAPGAPRAPVTAERLRAAVTAALPRWQVPDTWWVATALPRGATGKVDRVGLTAGLAAGAFAPLGATHYPESRSTGGVA